MSLKSTWEDVKKAPMKEMKNGYYKLAGIFMIWGSIKDRAYWRDVVYNHVLQHNLQNNLNRLWERNPTWNGNGWNLHNKNGQIIGEVIFIKDLPYEEFHRAYHHWKWLDDDSDLDTTDPGYINSITAGPGSWRNRTADRTKDFFWYRRFLPVFEPNSRILGKAFELGSTRAGSPYYNFWCTLAWTLRNSAMNRQYFEDNY